MKTSKTLIIGILLVGMIIGSLSISEVKAFVFGSIQQIPEWIRDGTLIKLRTETNNVRIGNPGTFFVDNNGIKVSIGTTTPSSMLTILNSTSSQPILNLADNTGLTKLIVLNSGNVGIGTTTPAYILDVAGNIRAQTSLTAGINIETLSANKTLNPGTDKMYQYLSTGGTNRTVYLATTTASAGDRFIIRNNDAYNSSYVLYINQGGTNLDIISAQSIKEYIFDGTNWVSGDVGTGIMYKDNNVSIGAGAFAYTQGTAVGYSAGGYSYGAAVGFNAYGGYYGAAVGCYARGDSWGAAVGNWAYGDTWGAAVGNYANGQRWGAAVGNYAKGMRYGAALGYQAGYNIDASADRYNVLVGAYSGYGLTTGIGNIIIGYKAGYDSTYSPTTGSYNILIGYNSWTLAKTTSNFLNIGGLIFGTNLSNAVNTVSTGSVGIGTTNPGEKLEVNGGIRLNTTTAKPTCDATHQGTLWFTQGATGVKDTLEVCAKDATDAYAWRTLY